MILVQTISRQTKRGYEAAALSFFVVRRHRAERTCEPLLGFTIPAKRCNDFATKIFPDLRKNDARHLLLA
jgi:hypothetical protein